MNSCEDTLWRVGFSDKTLHVVFRTQIHIFQSSYLLSVIVAGSITPAGKPLLRKGGLRKPQAMLQSQEDTGEEGQGTGIHRTHQSIL